MRLVIPLLFFPFWLTAQAEDFSCKIAHQEAHAAAAHFAAGMRSAVPDNYDQVYQRCAWSVDPAVQYIAGNVTTYFKPRVGGLSTLGFDLALNMTVDSVLYHGQAMPFTHGGDDLLDIAFPVFLPENILDSVTVFYQGAPVRSGFGTFVTELHQQTPVLWTLSEPYGAKAWWPCKQSLSDKIDSLDVFVRTPADYRVAGNGLLQSVSLTGAERLHHWKTRYPIAAYLVAIGVTNYAAYSDFVDMGGGDTLEVFNYVYPEHLQESVQNSHQIAEILQLFTQKAGPYPFIEEKYGHAQFGFGGGMEHQTMSFMYNFDYGLMAHEAAHQWFGDGVTCASWQDIWLNEGFATYFEGLTREAFFTTQDWYNWKRAKLNGIVSQPGGSVYCTDTTDIYRIFSGRLSYNKGAYVLHMLRFVLGDAAFFDGIRSYMNDPQLRYGYARTSDLIAHLEASSGRQLDAFFDQWVFGEGYPSYELTWSVTDEGLWSGFLSQKSTSMPASVPFFDIPVPVRLCATGLDTTLVMQPNAGASMLISFTPDSVAIDPDLWIISSNNSVRQTVATQEPPKTGCFSVFPNPGDDDILLDAPVNARVQVFDLTGRLMLEQPFLGAPLDVRALTPGGYVVHVMAADAFFLPVFWVKRR